MRNRSPKLKEKALYYSRDNEPIPKAFVKLIEKQKEKQDQKWNRYQDAKFSTPQNLYSSPTKRPIFTSPNNFTVPKRLFFPTTPSHTQNLTPNKIEFQNFEDSNQSAKLSNKNEIKSPDQYQVQPLNVNQENVEIQIAQNNNQDDQADFQEIKQEEDVNPEEVQASYNNSNQIIIQEQQQQIIEEQKLQEPLNQITIVNEEINKYSQSIQAKIAEVSCLKNVHTQQFIKLLYQIQEILGQIGELKDKQKITLKAKILQDLIAFFATVLPELECKIIQELVQTSISLANKKLLAL
ncbi:unnamed protein product (macronuclear) [Paramecium tetraurelia]|uniref:BAG domain-containing protein n=1 Tax=Paramecium tetraurelia TaxID=5888 RepID=A0E9N8_PARTE|nr:uncharacterized protein GSPATT00024736001 [Paramecium tetraurelia]CAK92005.1 unnamed protein product [Paramecium tetraurelia]|eukprot:XP_001459402.1 hypothetical protein (macronuclear) [Paramecium tetraurelia strain d4-2]